ncbi:MAG TPA: hypothetical protein VMU13_03080 [Candidatus Paceibacterota bacterium]|nr:hypothetical protein [Candidatus Paceibacterota bacterium]
MTPKNVVVIAGPSGSGKNSILEGIMHKCSTCSRLVTATTRPPRPGEENGVDYHFLSNEHFLEALKDGDILEHRFVESLGTHYGVFKPDLEGRIALGETVLAHLDIIGARYLKEHYGATTIFVLPDSFEMLEARVRARNHAMSDLEVVERMKIAQKEITEHAPQYDYRVINSNGKLESAIDEVIDILRKEGYNLG